MTERVRMTEFDLFSFDFPENWSNKRAMEEQNKFQNYWRTMTGRSSMLIPKEFTYIKTLDYPGWKRVND